MPQQKVTIPIPKGYRPEERQAIAQEIIEYIINRTAAGRDVNWEKFQKYSKEYADKKGVRRTDVNLILSGEMLSELQLLTERSGAITIGYPNDGALNGKVEGNRTGNYGKYGKTKPREFLGITDDDLKNEILSKFQASDEAIGEASRREARRIAGVDRGEDS